MHPFNYCKIITPPSLSQPGSAMKNRVYGLALIQTLIFEYNYYFWLKAIVVSTIIHVTMIIIIINNFGATNEVHCDLNFLFISFLYFLLLFKEARKGFWLQARATCSRHSKLHTSNDFLMKVIKKKRCAKLRKPEVNLARNISLYLKRLLGDLSWYFTYQQHSARAFK